MRLACRPFRQPSRRIVVSLAVAVFWIWSFVASRRHASHHLSSAELEQKFPLLYRHVHSFNGTGGGKDLGFLTFASLSPSDTARCCPPHFLVSTDSRSMAHSGALASSRIVRLPPREHCRCSLAGISGDARQPGAHDGPVGDSSDRASDVEEPPCRHLDGSAPVLRGEVVDLRGRRRQRGLLLLGGRRHHRPPGRIRTRFCRQLPRPAGQCGAVRCVSHLGVEVVRWHCKKVRSPPRRVLLTKPNSIPTSTLNRSAIRPHGSRPTTSRPGPTPWPERHSNRPSRFPSCWASKPTATPTRTTTGAWATRTRCN